MNIFQFEYFTTLAETLNYTKASQKLHITQPNLSKMIINLEHTIGSQLFIRNKRNVELTPAGKVFYEEIKKTVKSYENALRKTRDVEKGTTGVINLGFLGTAVIHLLPPIINFFQQHHPNITVNPMDYTYSPLLDAMADNLIDMAILPDLELDTIPEISKKLIRTDDMCVVVHEDHKFAKRDSVNLIEIKDEPFINMNPKVAVRDHNLISNICMTKNFLPNTVYEASTLLNMLLMVDCQFGITILADHMKHFTTKRVRFIPLKGFEHYFKVTCAWRSNDNPNLIKFLDTLDEYSQMKNTEMKNTEIINTEIINTEIKK